MVSSTEILTMCLIYFTLLKTACSIDCYQCSGTDSEHPFDCNEYLDADTDLTPSNCSSIHDAQFCIKHVGRFEGGVSTKRYCSSLDLGNYCQYVQQPGDKLEYRTCIYTCASDGCNSSERNPSRVLPSLVGAGVALLATLLRR